MPFKTEGKYGSVKVTISPAPKGVGIVSDETTRIMIKMAGVKDVWVKTIGSTGSMLNLAFAVFNALKNMNRRKSV